MNVLVVIPVRNRPNMVLEALDSVAAQTRPAKAIVVVDDGSTDETAEKVACWLNDRPALAARLLRMDHGGAPSARNQGLRTLGANMDAVTFLDSDDLLPADFLERTIAVLEQHQCAIAVSADQELLDVRSGLKRVVNTSGIKSSPWLFMLENGAALASCTVFRVYAIDDAGGFPEDIATGHDCILFGRIARFGAWHHVPGEPVVFRRNFAHINNSDADHLHRSYSDYEARWAAAAEQLAREAPSRADIGGKGWRLISWRWRNAAKQAIHCKNRDKAFQCIKKAFYAYPWSLKNIRLLLRFLAS